MFPPETKILIVDDMVSVRTVIVEMFNSLGFQNITEANNGADAWQVIQNGAPSFELIVSDLNMPKTNGMDLLIRVRSSDRFKTLSFLMISAAFEEKSILKAVKSGADHYLVKPFNPEELAHKLKLIFDKRAGVKTV